MKGQDTKGKSGIIGQGTVGGALQRGLSRAGYDVRAVGNDPAGARDVVAWADPAGVRRLSSGTIWRSRLNLADQYD